MRRLKAILIEEGLLGRGRQASTRVDREKVDQLVRMALKDPYEHLQGDGIPGVFEWEEREDSFESDPGSPYSEEGKFEVYVPEGGTFEGTLYFPAKVLKDYPELLNREFTEEVLQAILRKYGPKQFLEELVPADSLNDGGDINAENKFVTLRIKKYSQVYDVTQLRALKDPDTNYEGKVFMNFSFEATFSVEYEVDYFNFSGWWDDKRDSMY
jgi:hypothetical protein